jgi:hypothetical protein
LKGQPSDGMRVNNIESDNIRMQKKVRELQSQVNELKDLVNTLLSVIVDEPDGVHSGAAPMPEGMIPRNLCM